MSNYNGIDILKLKALGSHKGWNEMLTNAFNKGDVNRLAKINRELQIGMSRLDKKLVTEEMNVLFCRWTASLEKTAWQIVKIKNPLPAMDPLKAKSDYGIKSVEAKRQLYSNFKSWWTKNAF